MRFNGLALVAGAMAIVACSGGDKNAQQTSATQNDTAAARFFVSRSHAVKSSMARSATSSEAICAPRPSR